MATDEEKRMREGQNKDFKLATFSTKQNPASLSTVHDGTQHPIIPHIRTQYNLIFL